LAAGITLEMAKILLVEDDENLSETVSDWLTYQEHVVETAHSGFEAVEQLECDAFDLIILDWNLPGIEGPDICRKFRAGGGTTPIIMLTGMDSSTEKRACLDAGANDYLKKPFKLKDLSVKLDQYLSQQ